MKPRRDPAVFDVIADLYSRIRPGYSSAVVEFVIEETGGSVTREYAKVAMIARRVEDGDA